MLKSLKEFLFPRRISIRQLALKDVPPRPKRKFISEENMSAEERKEFLKELKLKRLLNPEYRAYELNCKKLDTELKVAIINFLSVREPLLKDIYNNGNKTLLEDIFLYVKNIKDID